MNSTQSNNTAQHSAAPPFWGERAQKRELSTSSGSERARTRGQFAAAFNLPSRNSPGNSAGAEPPSGAPSASPTKFSQWQAEGPTSVPPPGAGEHGEHGAQPRAEPRGVLAGPSRPLASPPRGSEARKCASVPARADSGSAIAGRRRGGGTG